MFDQIPGIAGITGHDDFNFAQAEVVTMPVGAEVNYLGIQIGSNPPTHRYYHSLPHVDGLTGFKVLDDILGDRADALGGANDRFEFGLVGFGSLGSIEVFVLEIVIEFIEEFAPLVVELDLDGRPLRGISRCLGYARGHHRVCLQWGR